MAESIEERHNNWLRVVWGLLYVREGLQSYVDGKGKEQYQMFMNNVNPECTFHEEMTREIQQNHAYKKPIWVNTDKSKWQDPRVGYWEVAKCYLSTSGYKDKLRSNDVDASGLLSICINSSFINKNLNKKLLEEVRIIRNNTLHDAHYLLEGKTADECLDKMIAVLEDPKELVHDKFAKEAAVNIKMIKAKTAKTPKVMNEALEQCVQTNVPVKQSLEEIESQMYARLHKELKESLDEIIVKVIKREEKIQSDDRDINERECNLTDLRQRLAACYQEHLNSAPISPLLPKKDERLDKIYVPPKIVEKNHRKVGAATKEKGKPVTSYRQMFYDGDKSKKSVFIVGEGGMGKSSFANMCALKWANQFSSSNSCGATDRDTGIECTYTSTDTDTSTDTLSRHILGKDLQQMFFSEMEDDDRFQDDTFFKEIGILFHVSLRDSCDICNLTDMIRDQLINRIYEPDDRDAAYSIMKNVLFEQKCVIIADGLDEWSHPDGTKCSCKEEDKVIPYLAPSINATLLVTSRPWRMSQQRVKDTKIDTYLKLEGTADVKLLVQKTLKSLNETLTEKKKLIDFIIFVGKVNLAHLLSVPIISMLLVCIWFEGMHEAFSLCDIYAYMMEMMIKRNSPTASQLNITVPRCFKHTQYVQKYYGIVMELAHLAFSTLFLNDRTESLAFENVDMLERGSLEFVLKTGILQEINVASLIRETSSYSFIHKTVQEFLAAVFMSDHPKEFQAVVAPFYKKYGKMSDVSQVFIFMCGLDMKLANEMSNMMAQSISIEYNPIAIKDPLFDIHSTIVSGYKEAKANQVKDIQLTLFSFDFHNWRNRSEVHALLRMNKSKVRHMIASDCMSKEELEEVFSSSADTLTYVGIDQSDRQYDLSACNRLQHLAIAELDASDIVVNVESLVSLELQYVSKDVVNKLVLSLRHGCENLKRLSFWSKTNISLFFQTLPLLTHLEYLHIFFTNLCDNLLLLPASVTSIDLRHVTITARSLRALVERLEVCTHSVKCSLSWCTVDPTTEFEIIKRYIQTSNHFCVHALTFPLHEFVFSKI